VVSPQPAFWIPQRPRTFHQYHRGSTRPLRVGRGLQRHPPAPIPKHRQTQPAIERRDVHVDGKLLRFWIGDNLVKTAPAPAPARYETNGPSAPADRPSAA